MEASFATPMEEEEEEERKVTISTCRNTQSWHRRKVTASSAVLNSSLEGQPWTATELLLKARYTSM